MHNVVRLNVTVARGIIRSNSYADRWARSAKEEWLSKRVLLGEASLRRALANFIDHFHSERNHQGKGNIILFRTHLSLGKDTPEARPVQPPERGNIIAIPQVGDLHHRYERRAS